MTTKRTLKICEKGHRFYKSSDCPSCPVCMELAKPSEGFLSRLSSPARNALIEADILTVERLAEYTQKEILALHGMGAKSLPALEQALASKNLAFKK